MKNQQVIPDYAVMLNSSIACLILAFGGWVLIRLIQAIILLPRYLERQQQQLAAIHSVAVDSEAVKETLVEEEESDTKDKIMSTTDLPSPSQNIIVKKDN